MGLFKKLQNFFSPQIKPLVCTPQDVFAYIEECIAINAPIGRLVIEHNGARHRIGVTADYDSKKGFFDIAYYLDDYLYTDYAEFKIITLDGSYFCDLERITVIEDEDCGDPRANTILAGREIFE